MIITNSLKKLANMLPSPLYIVGGAVRDYLLGISSYDIDIASDITPAEMVILLKNTDFSVVPNSPKLGTLKISIENEYFEYTTFRTDSYQGDGSHSPIKVDFTTEIKIDALRRDFTVNAIYYNVLTNQIVDPLGGQKDLENRLLKATSDGAEILRQDSLRILRMVRFASTYGLTIDPSLKIEATNFSKTIVFLPAERIRDEFSKMLVADTIFGIKDAHTVALQTLVEIGAMEFVIPELLEGIGITQRSDFHKYDVYNHILKTIEYSEPSIRLASLFHDIAKPRLKKENSSMKGHDLMSCQIVRMRLSSLKFNQDIIKKTELLTLYHMFDLKCELPIEDIRLFVQQHMDIIVDLIALKRADYKAGGVLMDSSPCAQRLEDAYNQLIKEGVPTSIDELSIDGTDLIELAVPATIRGSLLKALLNNCANNSSLINNKDAQLEFIKTYKK